MTDDSLIATRTNDMRIFKTFVEAYKELERELKHNGVIYQTQTVQDKDVRDNDDFKTKELLGYSFLVRTPQVDQFIKELNLNQDWIRDEFTERISAMFLNPGEAWKHRQEIWEEFIHDGKFGYTYSERIGYQVQEVIALLKKTPFSRHAIVNIYHPEIDNQRREGTVRVPCTMYYNFMIRPDGEKNKLHMIYNIRSNDFSTHFPYDLVLARLLQEYIASELGVETGDFIYQGGSFHVFYKDNKEIF